MALVWPNQNCVLCASVCIRVCAVCMRLIDDLSRASGKDLCVFVFVWVWKRYVVDTYVTEQMQSRSRLYAVHSAVFVCLRVSFYSILNSSSVSLPFADALLYIYCNYFVCSYLCIYCKWHEKCMADKVNIHSHSPVIQRLFSISADILLLFKLHCINIDILSVFVLRFFFRFHFCLHIFTARMKCYYEHFRRFVCSNTVSYWFRLKHTVCLSVALFNFEIIE